MRTLIRLLILGALLMPLSANALQLRWSTGGTELTFESARLCTLVVEADGTLDHVPYEWRVLWATEGCPLRPLTKNPQLQGDDNNADVCGVEWPKTASEVAANMSTAHFCSDGTDPATTARVVFEIPGGCRGKLLAVTIDPDDSTHVLSSAEVTFNGGTSRAYPPSVLRAAYTHNELDLTVEVTGTGLSSLENASLLSKDASWRFPLTVSSQSDQRLTATARAAAAVPGCNLDLSRTTGEVGTIGVAAEEFDTPTSSLAVGGVLTDLNPRAYPKDFAFIHERGKFEVWYTRQHMDSLAGSPVVPFDSTSRALGHATSSDLQSWTVDDTLVLPVRNGRSPGAGKPVEPMKWDNWHIWAPSINKVGMTYYMFYTGVSRYKIPGDTTVFVQKIGLATSADLVNWTRRDQPVLTTLQVPWAAKSQIGYGCDLRDPFVMPDPDVANHAGEYVMYYTAVDTVLTKSAMIGFARSPGLPLENWSGWAVPLRHTDKFNHYASGQDYPRVESPHLFFAQNKWWQLHTAHNGVSISLNSSTPYDTALSDSTRWKYATWFNYYELLHKSVTAPNGSSWATNGDPSLRRWYASEYLKVQRIDPADSAGRHEYLAAANDSIDLGGGQVVAGLEFREISWTGAQSLTAGAPTVTSVAGLEVPTSVGLHLIGFRPGQQGCEFRIDSPAGAHIRLILYDVMGRRLRTIKNGAVSAGATKIAWDGRDDGGMPARSGVYFARLESPFGRRVVRLPLVR